MKHSYYLFDVHFVDNDCSRANLLVCKYMASWNEFCKNTSIMRFKSSIYNLGGLSHHGKCPFIKVALRANTVETEK